MDRTCDLCLWVAVLIVPLTMAGIQEIGVAIFVGCSLLMGLAWAARQLAYTTLTPGFSGAEIIAFAAIGLVGLQLVPFSPEVLNKLAPFSAEYLALWGEPSGRILGGKPWATISLTPALTRSGLVLLIGYCVFFLTVVRHLKTMDQVDQAIRLVAVSATVMAVIGLVQLFLGNGKFLWVIDHPFRHAKWPAKGTFTNQNHFAQFLALGIGPLIWCWQNCGPKRQNRHDVVGQVRAQGFGLSRVKTGANQQYLVVTAASVVVFACLLTFSRGGITAFTIAILVSATVLSDNWRKTWKLVVPLTVFAVVGVTVVGTDALEQKWNSVVRADSLESLSSGRFHLWAALKDAVPHFWQAGSGLGSHAEVYPTWMSKQFGLRYSHAESGYLQVLLELGVPGLVLLAAGIGLCARWCWKTFRSGNTDERQRITVLAAGLVASVTHSLIDFVWYIPGTMILTLVIAACACRCYQLRENSSVGQAMTRKNMVIPCVVIALLLPAGRLAADVAVRDAASEQDWMNYRRHAIVGGDESSYESLAPLDERLDLLISHLENCVTTDPADFRAMSDLSALYLRRFDRDQLVAENQMSVREIRNTVRSVGFESNAAVGKWLFSAFGKSSADLYRALITARIAVRGQPLRGETYLVLAQVGFLSGHSTEGETALIDQAVRLRPHSAPIQYLAGMALIEQGDVDGACKHWHAAFAVDPQIRRHIIHGLASQYSANEVVERLDLKADGVWLLYQEYRQLEQPDQQRIVAGIYETQFHKFLTTLDSSDRSFWHCSYEIFTFLGRQRKALSCLHQAVRQQPGSYVLRSKFAMELLSNRQYEECRKQLEWCRLRRPDDEAVNTAIAEVMVALVKKKEANREQQEQ
ncbi:MAG: O-antigen ligase family protein [Fuerstiella sp.]|nr:O-antigen ligase family protein [Fuerstiella sp.]